MATRAIFQFYDLYDFFICYAGKCRGVFGPPGNNPENALKNGPRRPQYSAWRFVLFFGAVNNLTPVADASTGSFFNGLVALNIF